jgi:hypothetical protein
MESEAMMFTAEEVWDALSEAFATSPRSTRDCGLEKRILDTLVRRKLYPQRERTAPNPVSSGRRKTF